MLGDGVSRASPLDADLFRSCWKKAGALGALAGAPEGAGDAVPVFGVAG